ncbi:hypothetical protein Poli38472_006212 [Pythium oligandrum]|uniref:Uncharacterized protein n=1 Tax=Pythium oligandrum TaxID=41045 RepID=A0A8K1FPV2_PYTOL|nr:hypothetical protein Poli38472_006212 [Pythium oligandrum]|eukprot:TMW68744.1 hypothetical protein Poli38472_006212 [Pythium oligandrum]
MADDLSGNKATAVTRPVGMPVGSGTTSTLAITAFRQRVEEKRTHNRSSEKSMPRSGFTRGNSRHTFTITTAPSVSNILKTVERVPEKTDLVQNMINAAPGCYEGDDGSSDISDRYNFFAHGKRFLFATSSLGYFDETSAFRRRVIWLVTSKQFDQFVLGLIFANSIILALPDLSKMNTEGELDSNQSLRNAIVMYADSIFTALFFVECSLKIIAMGLFSERGAYLMDPWSWVDFVVVFVGLIAFVPGIPSVSGLRALRVLRPLRFLNAVPGIKKLVTALLKSIPELLSVVAFLSFLFFLYGVIGVQLWSGVLNARCRLTPHPVKLDPRLTLEDLPEYQARVLANVSAYWCRDEDNEIIPLSDASWTHDSSPWRQPRACYWPIPDEATPRTCNIDGNSYRQCPTGQTCGSDYDTYGNFRFTHPDTTIQRVVLNTATYNANLNYGVTSFDHIGFAALVIFSIMPREGWTNIMYMVQDAGYGTAAAIYFVSFVLIGSYFMLNLALAVIWENFSDQSLLEAEEERTKQGVAHSARKAIKTARSRHVPGVATVRLIVEHWLFAVVRTLLILVNTVILSLDQYPIDQEISRVVDTLNFVLTIAFTIEMALKFIGLGYKAWLTDRYNIFDAAVVVVSIAEVCLTPPEFIIGSRTESDPKNSFSGLRSVRIFALFKLARYWPSLEKLLATIVSTIQEIGNFSVLLLLFMYIYALIGMQVFGNRFRFDEYGYPVSHTESAAYIPRANFDTILWSMVTIFQVLTGENWTNMLFDGWRSVGWPSAIYFISLVIMGNFILLNLFLAILLGNFEDQQDDNERLVLEKEDLRRRSRVTPMHSSGTTQMSKRERRRSSVLRQHTSKIASGTQPAQHKSGSGPAPTMSAVALAAMNQKSAKNVLQSQDSIKIKSPTGRALGVLGPRNWIRKNAWAIVHHPHFDKILLVLVIMSTVSVALDNPLSAPDSAQLNFLAWTDRFLTILFLVEVVLKVIAQGLYFDPNAYLKNNWNVMDFVITIVSVFGLQADSSKYKYLKTLRTFRSLRPLRLINRNAGMKLVVSSLFAAVPQIVNVLMVCILVLTIFSILAVNNLKGKFYSCNGPEFDSLSDEQQQLVTFPRLWANLSETERGWFNTSSSALYEAIPIDTSITSRQICGFLNATWSRTIPQSFDNVLLGWRTFFEISTTEGWVTLMLTSVDATAIDMQPRANYRERWTLFFITFIFVGSFFVIQLFIGVVIENFNRMKEKLDGTFLLSTPQREWLMISEAILNLRPLRKMKEPRHKFRRFCFRVAHNPSLDTAAMGCIILNTFMMALTYIGEEDLYRFAIDYSNYFFAIIFTIEAAVKIIGLGRYYWKDSWNIFDFAIVVGSFFGMLYTWVGGSSVGSGAATIRSVRVARLVKLIQTWPSLHQLVNTLLITLPSLVSIGGFLFLVFFVYAALGVQLFAKVKMGDLITADANFQSLSNAMVTLIRCATGEQWNDLMHEFASTKNCVDGPDYDSTMCGFSNFQGCQPLNGCGTPVAFVYFMTFTMLVTFVLLNIFVAVILEGFSNEKDRASGVLLPQHYENFVATWSVYDPEATGLLEWHLLPKLLQDLDEPLGFGSDYEASMKEMKTYIQFLDFGVYNGNKVFMYDVARKLGKFVLDVVNGAPVEDLPSNIEVDQKWKTLLRGSKIRKMERATHRLNHIHAAVLVHEAVTSSVFRDELIARVKKFTELTKSFDAESGPQTRSTTPTRKNSRRGTSSRALLSRHESIAEKPKESKASSAEAEEEEDDEFYDFMGYDQEESY